jgi:hypothetical protein
MSSFRCFLFSDYGLPSFEKHSPGDEFVYQDQYNRLIPIFSTSNFNIAGIKPGITKG